MKIEKINLYNLSMKLRTPFETSFGRIDTRDCLIIEIFSQGLSGYGECTADRDPGYSYETTKTAWHILDEFVFPVVLEKEMSSPESFQALVGFIRGHQMAKAGVEMALWDLYGKMHNRSLRQMLGGVNDTVRVGVSVGLQETSKKLVEVVGGYLDNGYCRIKIKIKPGRDIEDTSAVRQAFPDILLQVDANSAFSLSNVDALLPLDDMNLILIEQPLADDDLWDHHLFQKKMKTPICLDESIHSTRHARQALEMQACRIINIKAGRVGGLSEGLAIHNLCQDNKIPVWCGGMLETGVGRAANLALASLPGFSLPGDISASDRYYERDITHQRFILNSDSTINVPDGAGLGITVDHQALKMVTLAEKTY